MIESKKDHEFYLKADYISSGRKTHLTFRDKIINTFIEDEVWEYQKALRKVEYIKNCKHHLIGRIEYAFALRKLHKQGLALGFCISPNSFGPGLYISHPGTIIVNPNSRIGENCYINPGTSIATQAGPISRTPVLGDNIYIGPGCKIFGKIEIADNIAIGANSVVNKSFLEPNITIAGIPAKKISNKGSDGLLIKGTNLAKHL